MKTNRMMECYCRINATADDAAIAWSIPQSAYCNYPIKRVKTCTQTRWLYCQASKGRLQASDCRTCRRDEPNGGSHQEGLKRGAIKINQINLKAGYSSNREDKVNEVGGQRGRGCNQDQPVGWSQDQLHGQNISGWGMSRRHRLVVIGCLHPGAMHRTCSAGRDGTTRDELSSPRGDMAMSGTFRRA